MTIRYNIDGKERVHVESYVLYEWVEEVQEVTLKGYKLCLENDRFPHSYVGYYSAYFDKVVEESNHSEEEPVILLVDEESVDPDTTLAFPGTGDTRTLSDIDREIEAANQLLAEEIAAKNAEDAQEQASSPAEQVNNQDADTATDIGAFPQRGAEPTPQPERPARRGRPPRNAQ